MPITEALYDVLFNGEEVKQAVDLLMNRSKTNEMEELFNILDSRQQD